MKTTIAVGLLALATTSFADDFSLLGTWRGHLTVSGPPPSGSPRQRERQRREMAEMRSATFTLQMFRDHRYTIHNFGPTSLGPKDSRGIWSKRGSSLSLIRTGTSKPYVFVVGPAERRMTSSAVFGPVVATFVFTR